MAPPATFCSQQLENDRSTIAGRRLTQVEPGEDIVISGLAGIYPNSKNVYDFRDNLFNKQDLVSADNRRWDIKHPEIPERGGRLYEIEKFDAAFFGVHYKQAQTMDPMGRLLLEKTFEAIVDAGIHPSELKGTKTGVFIGACFSEAEKTWFYEKLQPHGVVITGCIRSMMANRISYWLGVDGPSYTVDTACSSSLYAIEHAYRLIRMGHCDTAIVGGCNLCLHPYVTLQFARLGVLNKDGNCKCFDETADGYTRAEAIVIAIIQKSKDARRVYCQYIHAKTNCDGYKEQGITYPSGALQTTLLNEFYSECHVNPSDINYVEAHGTGTKVGDPEELNAIETIFCPEGRKTTLMIGSVKSNIGHSEPASGLASITKVILAMETGYLIPNINFSNPRKESKALQNGRMKVITESTKWNGGYAAVSSFGFGGANCHILLKSNTKEKVNNGIPQDDIPRLVYISGRTEEAINTIFDYISTKPMDAEYIGLLHEVFKYDIPAHVFRGYALLNKKGIISREMVYYPYDNKPLWFVFSGLGSQWFGMATDLMKIPVFSGTIEQCHQILSKKGINITDLITKNNTDMFTRQTNILVAITSVQIALLELLKFIDIKPVGVLGYSIGEIACAYYDNCLNLEQALLCSYYLGQASDHCKSGSGSMIFVETSEKKIKELLTERLEVSCINSEKNCAVSGPTMNIQEFIKLLKELKISFVDINMTLAYHSTNVKEITSSVLKHLKTIIPKPKERSKHWISTIAIDEKNKKICSAEFLSSVLVKPINLLENYSVLPSNAVTLEISPHGLLQNVLKRSAFNASVHVFTLNKNSNSLEILLSAIGKLYKEGYNPRIERIYPRISFPVSRGTSMVSPLIKWNHSQDWFVTKFEVQDKIKSGERTVSVKLNDDELEYLAGHTIDGRLLYPATGYLAIVWETVGMVRGQIYTELSVVFEDVKFHRATNIPKEGRVNLIVMVQKVSGNFEVIEGGAAIVTGRIYVPDNINDEIVELPKPVPQKKDYYLPLTTRDIYKELRLRGYNYSGLFRGLHSCDTTVTTGEVIWKGNWVAFMDTILQLLILQKDTRGLFVPTAIEKLIINSHKHKQIIESLPEGGTIPAYVHKHFKTVICGGIEIHGTQASAIGRRKNLGEPVLETFKFVPNILQDTDLSLAQSVRILLHIVMDNIASNKVKTTEVLEENSMGTTLVSPIIVNALGDIPLVQPDINVLTQQQIEINGVTVSDKKLISETNCVIVIAENILKRGQTLQAALNAVVKGGFIIARECIDVDLTQTDLSKINIVADHKLQSERLILLSKISDRKIKTYIDITDVDNKFDWLPILQNTLKTDPSPCIYTQGDEFNGILGFQNCLRREAGTENVVSMFIMDKYAPKFDPNNEFYDNQLKKQMSSNVLKNGQWGTYRHMLLNEVKNVDVEHAYVNVTVRGDLSSLRWLEGKLSRNVELDCNQVLIHTYYSAMNFRDIMTSTGRIASEVVAEGRFAQECVQGLEFSGRLTNGRRVIGMVPHLAMATLIAADRNLIWDIPDHWSLEEAVTIPVVYGTVLFAFIVQGKICPGMSVLIHAGTGGVGQAAINIALYYKCTVYTTVGTPEKREFIKKNWPQITDNQIGNSRDTSFEQMIMSETNGRGVDLILNSLAEEKLLASVRCLARGGKFLEIGKFDISKDNPLPLNTFAKEASFHGIMLDTFFTSASSYKQIINNLIEDGIKMGAVKPLHRCVFKENDIEEMFRYMAAGKHMGKVLIKIREEEPAKIIEPSYKVVKALPRYYSTGNGSYVVTGGLGGFGLELVDWLILRGVKKIILTSRKGITTGYQAMRLKLWRSYGVEIIISTADITTYDGCQTVMKQALQLGPVEAIFNLAVVLKDALFVNQTKEQFAISFGAKAIATKYLDELSRELCPKLKQFVIFSSVSCGRGNAGQTNYGMSNSVMERICEKRHEDGLPALAVEWGAVGDVGLIAEMQEDNTELVIGGTLQQKITNCLAVLDQFLRQKQPIVASMLVAEKRSGSGAAANIVDAVVNILGIRDIKTVSVHSSLAELGMDSIMAVEIKQTLEREFEVFLTPQDIRSMTFARLHEIASEREANQDDSKKIESIDNSITFTALGMHFLTRAIGDEESANKPVIILPSNVVTDCKERAILIPGIEGMANVLGTLASHLTAHAICLQLGYLTNFTTIQEMAEILLQRTLANLPDLQAGFTIIAYSFGSSIALELAALLEARGSIGQIVFIDGSPDMLKLMARDHIKSDLDEDLQDKVLSTIINLFAPGEAAIQFKSLFEKCSTWDSKVEILMKYQPPGIEYSVTHYERVINAVYLRTKAILNYKSTVGKLKSKFKLIKPRQHTIITATEDFGLSEFTSEPVEVVYVEGNHILIIENPECSQEINKVLTKEVRVEEKKSVISTINAMNVESVKI